MKAYQHRAEMFPGAVRIRESGYHKLLLQVQLDLDPGTASLANLVSETGAFADQFVEAEILGLYQSSSMSLVKLIEWTQWHRFRSAGVRPRSQRLRPGDE
jgi:hypothetical protein